MPQPTHDTLIIGQGLAGSALAWHLVEAGQRVVVIDDGHRSSSSLVAAGLVNPLAGMRFGRRPQVDDWLGAADDWYDRLAERFGARFFHPLPMLRLFRSAAQQRFYRQRADDPACAALLGSAFSAAGCPEPVAAPQGGFTQHRTGYVDLPLLLDALRRWLGAHALVRTSRFGADQLQIGPDLVSVADIAARRLVFCDGARLRDNPWFGHLPLAPDKGEILNLRFDDWRPRHIVNGAHWLVPLANGEVRFGATHDHAHCDDRPTATGRETLLSGLAVLREGLPGPTVVAHQAGVRPGTRDRYPLVGRHRDHPALHVFNGFGARGALTIPWYARCMADHLLHGSPLPPEADIRRFA